MSSFTAKSMFTSISELFKKQVNKTPNAIALVFQEDKLTYKELDKKSNQLAQYLQECGVRRNTLVGCSLDKSLDLIITILGILKAGGAYVPLEPTYPRERIDYMIKDVAPPILLTQSHYQSNFVNFLGRVIYIDKEQTQISRFDKSYLSTKISPDQLAYVIYTSGSTGHPKGIMVEHSSFTHGSLAHNAYYPKKLTGLLSGPISFDVSLLLIFHLLLSGGTIYIPDSGTITNIDKLVDIIKNKGISYILCVPSLYSMILGKSCYLPCLKIVSLTGENIPNSIMKLHPKFVPNAVLYNEYGPTEYAIGTTIGIIYDPKKKKTYPINVGKPLSNTYVHILNEHLSQVPNNTKGEIFISGLGLAKGYLHNPSLTAEKFIPFESKIFYKTGDFGRFLPNGNLEFLGRIDNQVKILGNRVELGEIEHALLQYPQVNEVIVTCEKHNEANYLVAYFTTLTAVDKKALKTHLENLLPRYMIPSVFIHLPIFPKTPNGKIDRSALLSMFKGEKSAIVQTLSSLEKSLITIWQEVLNVQFIACEDNFFDLGGDSLKIARVQASIAKKLSIEISIATLLQYPTIFELLKHLDQKENTKESGSSSHKRKLALQWFDRKKRKHESK